MATVKDIKRVTRLLNYIDDDAITYCWVIHYYKAPVREYRIDKGDSKGFDLSKLPKYIREFLINAIWEAPKENGDKKHYIQRIVSTERR